MKRFLNYAALFGLAGIVIALDQWTKWLVRVNIPEGGIWMPDGLNWLTPYARIIHWHNTGAAFGMFQGYPWVFTILAFLVAGLIIYFYGQIGEADWWLKLAMGLQLGGALGNVVDRVLREGRVTDFLSVGTFPVFNVADSSITVGTIVLLIGVWITEQAHKKAEAAAQPVETEAGTGE